MDDNGRAAHKSLKEGGKFPENFVKAAMSTPRCHFYEFGPFHVDAVKGLLLRDGELVSLTPKAFDILLVLVENHGEVLTKDELMRAVWPDTVVEENNLARNISTLRKALVSRGLISIALLKSPIAVSYWPCAT